MEARNKSIKILLVGDADKKNNFIIACYGNNPLKRINIDFAVVDRKFKILGLADINYKNDYGLDSEVQIWQVQTTTSLLINMISGKNNGIAH